ncbi:MAG: hypothetical protein KDD40_12170, partial [Bdellovibrionales bacterium]|nr:hypothetical protein [Bdellovibrionales bacterium]
MMNIKIKDINFFFLVNLIISLVFITSCKLNDSGLSGEIGSDSPDTNESIEDELTYAIESLANGLGSAYTSIQINIGDSIDLYSTSRIKNKGTFKDNVIVTWGLNGSIGSLTITGESSNTTFQATTAGTGEIYISVNNVIKSIQVEVIDPGPPVYDGPGVTFNGSTNFLKKYHSIIGSTSGVIFTKIRRVYNASYPSPCITWVGDLQLSFNNDQLKFDVGGSVFSSSSTNVGSMDGNWHTLLIAWADSTDPNVSVDTFQVYWDDVALPTGAPSVGTVSIMGEFPIGSCSGTGAILYTGDMDSYFYVKNQYLDISVDANRRKFYENDGTLIDID